MKKLLYFLTILLLSAKMQAQCGSTDIGGTVYLELPANGSQSNTYGIKDSNEPGISAITVNVYDSQGILTSTTTDNSGEWNIPNPSFPVRVEFSWNQSWLQPSHGAQNMPVRFIAAADCNVNFGLQDPNDYSSTATPDYVTNLKVSGDAAGHTLATIQTVGYNYYGLNSNYNTSQGVQGTGPIPVDDALIAEIGSNWSKTFQKSKQRMFLPAVLWRHASFAAGTGLGNIFVMDYSGASAQVTGNFDLQGITPINGGADIDLGSVCRDAACANDSGNTGVATDYIIDNNAKNIDLDAFTKVAKVGFGGIDFDNNTESIWLINLNQKGIIKIDASGDLASMTNTVSQYLITSIPGLPSVTGGELRPWAITIYRGKGYLGLVNDGISSQNINDMKAYVLSFDLDNPMAGFTTELTIDLNYDKDGEDWHPWLETFTPNYNGFWQYYTQPVLSDIDFDELGNMYLAFMDRFGLQTGFFQSTPVSGNTENDEHHRTKGEILKVCNTSGTFEVEGTGSCPTNGNEFFDDLSGDAQPDGSNGALAIIPGSNQLILQMMDPHPSGLTGEDYWTSHGTETLNTTTGAIEGYYTYALGAVPYSGKGLGMGDIEFLTDHAPIQMCNRVWEDTDADGIQDPGEPGIPNVEVSLVKDGIVVATASTNGNGMVIFSSDPVASSTSSEIYNLDLANQQAYTFQILNAEGSSQQAALAGKILTLNNIGEGTNTENNDSDAALDANNTASIGINSTEAQVFGANVNAIDFGFAPAGTLPIQVAVPLRARVIKDYVVLDWTTEQELNNRGFDIQKSQDGQNWTTLEWITGQGTSDTRKQYIVYDYAPFAGINYYRYIQADFDEKKTTSHTVSAFIENTNTVNYLYPNPSKDIVYIQRTQEQDEPLNYAIFNILGEQVSSGVASNNQINLSNLSKGMYIIKLSNEKGLIGTFRQMHRTN